MDAAKSANGILKKGGPLEIDTDFRDSNDASTVNGIPTSATPASSTTSAAAAAVAASAIMNGMIDSDDDRSSQGPLLGSKRYDESEDSDSEENNLSFEQLKNELIVLKRKKKELKNAQVNENQVLNPAPSLLGYTESTGTGCGFGSGMLGGDASPEDSADHWRVMGLLEASKKRAKTVIEMFLPSVFGLRRLIRVGTVAYCGAVQCGVVWCGEVLCTALHFVLYCPICFPTICF
jgi:hypothetical protein